MPLDTQPTNLRRPILMVVVGRQRVGKTTVISTIIQKIRECGGDFRIWNADVNNTSYNLGLFHDDVKTPPSNSAEEVKRWIEILIEDQALHGYDAVLDVGGGETPFTRLVEELPVMDAVAEDGVLVVVVHVVGTDQADVDYLQAFSSAHTLDAEATVIILNNGLVLGGKTVGPAFDNIRSHPAILEALSKNALLLSFPRLGCMSEVIDRKMTFRDAAKGIYKPGTEPLLKFDRLRTRLWFDQDIPYFLSFFPKLWLPLMSNVVQPTGGQAKDVAENVV